MHKNLGHPLQNDFTRLMNQHGVNQAAISLSRRLRCAACLRSAGPKLPRPTKVPRVGSFNSVVSLDYVYVKDADGTTWQCLNILDLSGDFQLVYVLESRDPAT